ncbi:TRAM domain-containing protein [Candidatus Saccharibacteria bacterium]|nr:TRAM domain-containing protein [Candidatus Saccharibacteria bacterium]MCL1962961.1 TRAM domain-containing protein [Candidatus Saccharibacteria bacterium]
MKIFDPEVVYVDKIVYGGQGLGELSDGRKVFVWGALPGETVRIEITKSKKSYAEGIAVEILTASPDRVEPRDECYLSTSPWQIMSFDREQEWKSRLVREAFEGEEISLESSITSSESSLRKCVNGVARVTGSPVDGDVTPRESLDALRDEEKIIGNLSVFTDHRDYFYRNKMEYSLWWDNESERISLAFHKRGSHQKIPITTSSIEHPEIFAEAQRIVAELNEKREEARKYQLLLVRANQHGEISSALFENGKSHPIMKNLTDEILGQKYSYSPNGFFQINLPVYEMALREIAANLGDAEKVVDMYAGVGTIGLSVARDRELTLVETNSSAYSEMMRNMNPVIASNAKQSTPDRHADMSARDDNIFGICAKSEDALEYITNDTTLILDPPRAGLDAKVVAKILESTPPRVIYLSCNPVTQARDIKSLLAKYRITRTKAFNFFPRTPHIENLVVLELNI